MELGDGRSVHDIVLKLYREQLAQGAGLADIDVWRSLFDRSVVETIGDLRNRGYLLIKVVSMEEQPQEMSTSPNMTRMNAEEEAAMRGPTADVARGQLAQVQGAPDGSGGAAPGRLQMAQAWTSQVNESQRTGVAPRPGVPTNIFYRRPRAPVRSSFPVEMFRTLANVGRRGLAAVDGILDRAAGLGRR